MSIAGVEPGMLRHIPKTCSPNSRVPLHPKSVDMCGLTQQVSTNRLEHLRTRSSLHCKLQDVVGESPAVAQSFAARASRTCGVRMRSGRQRSSRHGRVGGRVVKFVSVLSLVKFVRGQHCQENEARRPVALRTCTSPNRL